LSDVFDVDSVDLDVVSPEEDDDEDEEDEPVSPLLLSPPELLSLDFDPLELASGDDFLA
jgi:hypothetical protein